jgi:hypothetical protein
MISFSLSNDATSFQIRMFRAGGKTGRASYLPTLLNRKYSRRKPTFRILARSAVFFNNIFIGNAARRIHISASVVEYFNARGNGNELKYMLYRSAGEFLSTRLTRSGDLVIAAGRGYEHLQNLESSLILLLRF